MEDRSVIDVGNLDIYNEIVGLESAAWKRAIVGATGRVLTNWRNEAPRQYAISTLQKNSGSLVVTGFVQKRLTSITVDTRATVSIVRPNVVEDLKPIWCSCSSVSYTHLS